MARRSFDELDLAVYEAHSVAEVDGGATTSELRRCHPGPLPVQRLTGMQRRGLLWCVVSWDGYATWTLTARGLELAGQFRGARLSSKGGDGHA